MNPRTWCIQQQINIRYATTRENVWERECTSRSLRGLLRDVLIWRQSGVSGWRDEIPARTQTLRPRKTLQTICYITWKSLSVYLIQKHNFPQSAMPGKRILSRLMWPAEALITRNSIRRDKACLPSCLLSRSCYRRGHSFHDIQGLTRAFDVKSLICILSEFHLRNFIILRQGHVKIRDFFFFGVVVKLAIYRITQPSRRFDFKISCEYTHAIIARLTATNYHSVETIENKLEKKGHCREWISRDALKFRRSCRC